MPADIQQAKNFLLTTDFPIEKVIYLRSGSFTLGSITSGTETFSHGLSFTPLIDGVWSLDSDFSTTYNFGTGTTPLSTSGLSFYQQLLGFDILIGNSGADSSTVNINWANLGSSMTAYYRLYGLEPTDSAADVPFTASSGNDFILSTDFNYLKLYLSDYLTGFSASNTYTVDHNLGYRPKVSIWSTTSGGYRYPGIQEGADVIASVTTTQLVIEVGSSYNSSYMTRLDYRIYIDEA